MLRLARVLALIAGLGIAMLGLVGGSIGIFVSALADGADLLATITLSVSAMILSIGLGTILAWQAWQAIQGAPSTTFRPRQIWLLALLFPLAVLMGHLVLSLNLLPIVSFPLLHVAVAALPPLFILALVGRGLGEVTSRRDLILQFSSGAFLSTLIAFALEAMAGLSVLTAAFLGVTIQPNGPVLLQKLAKYLEDPTWLQDPLALAPSLMSPIILVTALAFVAGIIPLIEEAVKTIGVGIMAYRQPTLPQAFFWGLAGGAGFAFVEGLLNTSANLQTWTSVAVLRVGATLLHCFTGALVGLAWYSVLAKRHWGYGVGLYSASVAVHGLWNALSAGIAFASLEALGGGAANNTLMLASFGVLAILALLLVLALAIALALIGLTRHVRKRSLTLDRTTPHIPTPSAGEAGLQHVAGEKQLAQEE
jgi:hypothetical protein